MTMSAGNPKSIKYTCGAGTPEEAEANCTWFINGECKCSYPFFCEYRVKKQTNADRIRSMTDEEMAIYFSEMFNAYGYCEPDFLKWLQQESED